ncbi:hypothetical protein INT43_007314 [Umbelopsis isabellina]|uniref:RING-type domain-containing protein n=1 Tax=Mortierella isabellina TaxID=91625 RepID=A0A8H7PXE4_MORIS|nr:hypothetical protein INT43_007314 [Umbelopsis isabellina]
MSVTARPTDSHFSVMEQQAMLRWKELRAAAAESEDQLYSPTLSSHSTSGIDRSNNFASTMRTPREQKYPANNRYPGNATLRPDNPLSIEEKLSKIAEPTLCWCKKEASVLNTTVFGVIYECHNLKAFREFQNKVLPENEMEDKHSIVNDVSDPHKEASNQSERSSVPEDSQLNLDSTAEATSKKVAKDKLPGAQSDKEKTKGRAIPSNICGFHVHKSTWDQLRSHLQNGNDLNPEHPELNICPAFNLTFCATFRLANRYPKRSPPVPRCFCNFPVKMLLTHNGLHKNRVTFTCPNFDVDNARPKCSWALAAEEVPFIPSLFCAHEIATQTPAVNDTCKPSTSEQKEASPESFVDNEQKDPTNIESNGVDITDTLGPEKPSSQSILGQDYNDGAASESVSNNNKIADRQGIKWTKERHALGTQHAMSPVANGGVSDSMAGPSFSTYSADVEETEEIPQNVIPESTSRRFQATEHRYSPNDIYENSNNYRPAAPMATDVARQHQISLWKTMMHNKADNNVSEWMTGLEVANDGNSQHVPIYREASMEGLSWNYNGDRYNDNASYQSYQSPSMEPVDYGMPNYSSSVNGQPFYDTQSLRSQAVSKQMNRIVPSSVYRSMVKNKQASRATGIANPESIPLEVADVDVLSTNEASNNASRSSPSSPTRNKQSTKQHSHDIAALMASPPFVQRHIIQGELDSHMTASNTVNRKLDALEANFHKSISGLFSNHKSQLQQFQEELTTSSEESYALYDHIAKLEKDQRALILENEMFKREKLHTDQSFDKIQQLHTEEVELRRSCQRRTANLEIVIAEVIEQNERLQQELDEKNEVAKMSDFKCRVCWHNTITHATIPCYHCVYCETCADKVKECAMCRQEKEGTQRIYLG